MTAPRTTDRRNAELAKIHLAKKELGLDDAAYRGAVRRASEGRTETAAALTQAERGALLDHFKACGFAPKGGARRRRRADVAHDRKARALWRSLWELGAVRSTDDRALDAFARRLTGVGTLAWAGPDQKNAVVEALKDWCWREGYTVPDTRTPSGVRRARERLLEAQWAKLHALGAARVPSVVHWLHDSLTMSHPPRRATVRSLDDDQLAAAIEALGRWLRGALAQDGARDDGPADGRPRDDMGREREDDAGYR